MEVQVRNQMCIAVTVRIKHYLTCVILVHNPFDQWIHIEWLGILCLSALLTLQSIWEVIN